MQDLQKVINKEETFWLNTKKLPFEVVDGVSQLVVSDEDILDAENRLSRFAPFIQKAFPETKVTSGLIESPLVEIDNMKKSIESTYGCDVLGKLFLKMDSHLAIAGSVKARGGIYEVLKHAEDLVLANNLLSINDNYERFADKDIKDFLSGYTVQVGSTGNLGMSIGIMSAVLGFKVIVHMSADAKQWKKDLLRARGVNVIEYKEDYSKAVAEGRKASSLDPLSYFVDDEKSVDLFLGYAVAAKRLKKQLEEKGVVVNKDHPLITYIPAGVGGAPGGVSYGLKRLYKDCVHCFFVEPTSYPSVLLGIATQKFENANVHDYGIHGLTAADGLACSNPSSLVTRIMTNHLSGVFTVNDAKLYDFMRALNSSENIIVEPSGCAGFIGPVNLLSMAKQYLNDNNLDEKTLKNAVHIVWATGGALLPEQTKQEYLNTHL